MVHADAAMAATAMNGHQRERSACKTHPATASRNVTTTGASSERYRQPNLAMIMAAVAVVVFVTYPTFGNDIGVPVNAINTGLTTSS